MSVKDLSASLDCATMLSRDACRRLSERCEGTGILMLIHSAVF